MAEDVRQAIDGVMLSMQLSLFAPQAKRAMCCTGLQPLHWQRSLRSSRNESRLHENMRSHTAVQACHPLMMTHPLRSSFCEGSSELRVRVLLAGRQQTLPIWLSDCVIAKLGGDGRAFWQKVSCDFLADSVSVRMQPHYHDEMSDPRE